ncbi:MULTISPECIES: class I adenylate-forming enzyme family protein [Mycobacterium]|uniref:class I adenylate-forming enzyme family protein n=1 Tax=Mycobacterium TaxID=1763 RepID=UPI001152FDFE|nr:class I adenylate-forming enzyme family protein [Mycobacterium paraseoulense]MCV7393787.1 acyl--CoA ligase [Mycobacterium paraseoulense]
MPNPPSITAWREATLGDLLDEATNRWPDRAALKWPTGEGLASLTWTQVSKQSRAGAQLLRSISDGRAPVAVYASNSKSWYLAMWAAALAGRPLVPVNPALTGPELKTVLADSGASTVLAAENYRGQRLVELARGAAGELESVNEVWCIDDWLKNRPTGAQRNDVVRPADSFLIQYTSGTTGVPKGAVLSHRVCLNAAAAMNPALEPTEHEIYCSALPLYHIGALVAHALAMACIGGTYVMLDGFSAGQFLAAAAESGATILGGVPTMYLRMLDESSGGPVPLPRVRVLMVGGADIPESLIARLEEHFAASASVMYGQTEAPAITQTRLSDTASVKATTVGRAMAHRELRIIDATTSRPLPFGQIGEVCVRSPIRMDRYHNRPEATAATIDPDGWLRTGDLGSLGADGLLRIRGRIRDIVVRGGENIYAREVEDAIESHPDVAQAAVVGLADPDWGEIVAAAVVPRVGARPSVSELSQWVAQRLAAYKRPTHWRLVDQLPMTATGKPQKFKIVEAMRVHAGL